MATRILTQELLKSQLNYNPDTGVFTWAINKNQMKAGDTAGTKDTHGHLQIKILGKLYLAHRLAWLYMNGVWPKECIDHINCIRDDNRFSNLREATKQQNSYNSRIRKTSTTGAAGVNYSKRDKKYIARCGFNGKRYLIGYFDDFNSALIAREAFAKKHYGEFYNNA